MALVDLLIQKKSDILRRWFNLSVQTYHPDTAKFLHRQTNQFANPVGSLLKEGLAEIFDGLLFGADREKLSKALDRIIRIKAVESSPPSAVLAFVLGLKGIIRELAVKASPGEAGRTDDLTGFEAQIDDLLLLSFDLYAACRDKLAEIRIKDEERRIHTLLRRAKIILEPEQENQAPGPVDGQTT